MMLYPEGPNDPRAQTPSSEWRYTRDQVSQMTAFEAKSAGTLAEKNMERLGIDWVTFEGKRFKYRSAKPGEHYRLIVEATREKVRQNPEVKRVLMATGDLVLKPDHYGETNAPPEWRYYEILMMIRRELRGQLIPCDDVLQLDRSQRVTLLKLERSILMEMYLAGAKRPHSPT